MRMVSSMKIVCFGDSITKSYTNRFEKQLTQKYKNHKIKVINAGVIGETTVHGLKRVDSVLDHNPDLVFIGFGMNDWRKGLEKDEFKKNLSKIVDVFNERMIRTILLTMNPDSHIKEKISPKLIEFNKVIRYVAYDKKIRIADIYSQWLNELLKVEEGLYDEIHPNEQVGNEIICKVLLRMVFQTQTVIVWGFNGLYPFCNYTCEYCYVYSDVNADQFFRKDIDMETWRKAIKASFGNEKIIFYMAFGEPMMGLGFYKVLDMIAEEPNWAGHMTSNLSAPLERLVQTRLFKEKRMNINGSFHPTQTTPENFLEKILYLREQGVEVPVILVSYPPILKDLEYYVNFFSQQNFLVHVRRFRGWYKGKYYPNSFTDEQRCLIAKYCDDATIKYMLNESSKNLTGKLTYEGMFYLLMDENGDIYDSPDSKSDYLGNVFDGTVQLYTEPHPYKLNWNGSVNGIAALLETEYEELTDNFVFSFAKQGGVYRTKNGIYYKNLNTDFTDPKIRREYGFPNSESHPKFVITKIRQPFDKLFQEYISRKLYSKVERKRRYLFKVYFNLFKKGK